MKQIKDQFRQLTIGDIFGVLDTFVTKLITNFNDPAVFEKFNPTGNFVNVRYLIKMYEIFPHFLFSSVKI